jgi:hypothetical protein
LFWIYTYDEIFQLDKYSMFDARLKAGTPRVQALAFEGCHDDWGNIVKPGADPLTKGQENPKIVVFKYGRFFHLCFENE